MPGYEADGSTLGPSLLSSCPDLYCFYREKKWQLMFCHYFPLIYDFLATETGVSAIVHTTLHPGPNERQANGAG